MTDAPPSSIVEPHAPSAPSSSAPQTNSVQASPDPATFKYYLPSNVTRPALPPALPDEYYNPTPADLKDAQATLEARTKALVDAPLLLRSVREANEKAKRDRWPNTTIRVRFPDRSQLEKTFPSTNKIRSVYAFVRSCLREDVKPIKFILYQTPPKRDLKVSDPNVRHLTLSELHLAPSSILWLRFEDDSLNGTTMQAPLDPSILERAEDLPHPPDPTAVSAPQTPGPSKSSSANSSTGAAKDKSKLPKWLKLGQST
ncbi:hypothetical protein AX16_002420 [Volvariella volvacea WC 439]|nr:hypothetical protein AX16_002420 [Volvariella volvacea WC 439]